MAAEWIWTVHKREWQKWYQFKHAEGGYHVERMNDDQITKQICEGLLNRLRGRADEELMLGVFDEILKKKKVKSLWNKKGVMK